VIARTAGGDVHAALDAVGDQERKEGGVPHRGVDAVHAAAATHHQRHEVRPLGDQGGIAEQLPG